MTKIIKFGAKWCKGCSALDELDLNSLKDAEKIDVDSDYESVSKYNINKLPTVIVFEDDNEVERIYGKDAIVERFS